MLAMVYLLPVAFGLLLWRSYRSESKRSRKGETFDPAGKLRW
jgi:hypothetical protein